MNKGEPRNLFDAEARNQQPLQPPRIVTAKQYFAGKEAGIAPEAMPNESFINRVLEQGVTLRTRDGQEHGHTHDLGVACKFLSEQNLRHFDI